MQELRPRNDFLPRLPRARGALVACLVILGACGSTRRDTRDEVRWLVNHGQFEEAVQTAAAATRAHPNDKELQTLHRDASVAWFLDKGRQLTFEDQDDEALAAFRRALSIDPASSQARDWILKTNRKLARRSLDIALELHAKDDIEGALTAYDKALKYEPGDKDALTGRGLSLLVLNHRDVLGTTYFRDGLHALADYWLEQARSRFSYVRKYKPKDERARDRKTQVDTLLAIQRMAQGRDFESKHKFGAARNEYRLAAQLDPDNPDAKTGIDRCRIEMDVKVKLETAGMDIVRGRFDKATQLVLEAQATTLAQKDMCEGKLAAIREARLDKAYGEALALERDYRYEDAVAQYGELLQVAGYYKDVITRKDTLEDYIKLADELYARAQAEQDPAKKRDLLQQIRIFWPEYKDVAAQLKSVGSAPGG